MSHDPKTSLAVMELLAKMDFADLEKRVIYLSLGQTKAQIAAMKERALFYVDPVPFYSTPNLLNIPKGFITSRPLTMEELIALDPAPPPQEVPKSWGKKGKRQNPGQAYQAAIAGKIKGFR